ncbi:MAG: hypothetical protein ABI548_22320 [Polyangiaceae bacterium]
MLGQTVWEVVRSLVPGARRGCSGRLKQLAAGFAGLSGVVVSVADRDLAIQDFTLA